MQTIVTFRPNLPHIPNGEKHYYSTCPEKLEEQRSRASTRNFKNLSVKHATQNTAFAVLRVIKEALLVEQLPTLTKTHSSGSFLFPSIGKKMNDMKKSLECTISLAERLEFSLQVSSTTLTTESTHNPRIS